MEIYVPSDNFILNRWSAVIIDKINNRLKSICKCSHYGKDTKKI